MEHGEPSIRSLHPLEAQAVKWLHPSHYSVLNLGANGSLPREAATLNRPHEG